MRVLPVLFGLIVVAIALIEEEVAEEEWQTFKLTYGKEYADEAEELLRKQIFMETMLRIEKHNQNYEQGLVTFSMGINKFSDLRHEEFISMYGDGAFESSEESYRDFYNDAVNFIPPANILYPKEMDWRNYSAVTKVKDQKHCQSSWAFSVIGALETRNFLFKKEKRISALSAQQLVDCVPRKGMAHCRTLLPIQGFEYINRNGGIQSEISYPYTATKNSRCKFNQRRIRASIRAFGKIEPSDEDTLKKAVATVGPISITIFWNQDMTAYNGGIFPAPCNTNSSRSVLLVGYGTQNGTDYWSIKNSLGKTWGEEGYLRLDRKTNQNCLLAGIPVYPLL